MIVPEIMIAIALLTLRVSFFTVDTLDKTMTVFEFAKWKMTKKRRAR